MYHVNLHVTVDSYQDTLLVGSPLTHSSTSNLDSMAGQVFHIVHRRFVSRCRFIVPPIVGIFEISPKQWPHSLSRRQAGKYYLSNLVIGSLGGPCLIWRFAYPCCVRHSLSMRVSKDATIPISSGTDGHLLRWHCHLSPCLPCLPLNPARHGRRR